MNLPFADILNLIDQHLFEAQFEQAARRIRQSERLAISEKQQHELQLRRLRYGMLMGYFDETDQLFGRLILKDPSDISLISLYRIFRYVAGWTGRDKKSKIFNSLELSICIHEDLIGLVTGEDYILCLERLAFSGRELISMPLSACLLTDWPDILELIPLIGERILPLWIEAQVAEAWYSDAQRGTYPRLAILNDTLPHCQTVPEFADVIAYVCLLESLSQQDLPHAIVHLDQIISDRAFWLLCRVIDLSSYFGEPRQIKQISRLLHSQLPSRPDITGYARSFAQVVLMRLSGDDSSDTNIQLRTEVSAISNETDSKIEGRTKFWQAHEGASPALRIFFAKSIQEDLPESWSSYLNPVVKTTHHLARVIQTSDFLGFQNAWMSLPEDHRLHPSCYGWIEQVAVEGADVAPNIDPKIWFLFVKSWFTQSLDVLNSALRKPTPPEHKDWMIRQVVLKVISTRQEECLDWLKKHRREISEEGWSELCKSICQPFPSLAASIDEIGLSKKAIHLVSVLNEAVSRKEASPILYKALDKANGEDLLKKPVWIRLSHIFTPPLFHPASFELWYCVNKLRQIWNVAVPPLKVELISLLDDPSRTVTLRLLDSPLKPLLIDVPNIVLNEQIRARNGGDPFQTLEDIWQSAWNWGYYPILSYVDSNFHSFLESQGSNTFGHLKHQSMIKVPDAYDYRESKADFQILDTIQELHWQDSASILTRDHFDKKNDKDNWLAQFPWLQQTFHRMVLRFDVNPIGRLYLKNSDGDRVFVS